MKKTLLACCLLAGLTITSASAATINIALTDLTVQVADYGSNVFVLDARGVVFATVDNPGPVGGLILFGDPNAAFGQSSLAAFNGTFTELGVVALDFANVAIEGAQLAVPGAFSPGIPNPPTDLALLAISQPAKLKFLLDYVSTQQIDFGAVSVQLSTFNLASIIVTQPVPEPGSVALFGIGLALVGVRMLRIKRRR